ncbi:MAG: hydroxyacid dehydrogenase [Verrucomicrobia bacterium]|nr:MAG: hydroxyacid dehydrogenase [Verrucomicrobiota bacterium]
MSDKPKLPGGELLLYQTEDGHTRVECRFEEGTIWLTQAQIAELFQTTPQNVTLHLAAIFTEGELAEEATCKDYLQVRREGSRQVTRSLRHYRLEAILAVGYRVRSQRGTQFRQWATARLEEYLRKGFVLDDERLKNPAGPGVPDYFDELLERIRDIRASERRMYLRVKEIFALAADYDPKDHEAQVFFQTVQNKLHFAVTGKTAPELIAQRADHTKANMGLSAWRGGVVRRGDVTVAKNYLNEQEITELNRIVTMFLDFAEDQSRRRKQVFLSDWRGKLDDFLRFNERQVLPDLGAVSREEADLKAQAEYERFAERRRALAEAEGEKALHQLEETAKKIPRKKK